MNLSQLLLPFLQNLKKQFSIHTVMLELDQRNKNEDGEKLSPSGIVEYNVFLC
jgi:hypothetical protein